MHLTLAEYPVELISLSEDRVINLETYFFLIFDLRFDIENTITNVFT